MEKYNFPPIQLNVTLENIDEINNILYKLHEINAISTVELGLVTLQLLNKRVDLISLQTT